MYAARFGNIEALRLLLRHGADPARRANDGSTALSIAREDGPQAAEVVRILEGPAGGGS